MNEETLIIKSVDEWLEYCQQHYSKSTKYVYKGVVYQFLRILPEEITTIEQLHSSLIESYIKTIANKYSKTTLYCHRAAIKAFYQWLSFRYSIPDIIPKNSPKPIPVLKANDDSNVIAAWIENSRKFKYRSVISDFVRWLPDDIENIGQLRKEFIESYIESIKCKYNPNTMRIYRCYLRTFHRWISRQYGIDDVIPKKKKLPKPLPILKAPDGSNTIAEWLNFCKRLAPDTQRHYHRTIVEFVEYSNIETVAELNRQHIIVYLNTKINKVKNSTINKHLKCLKSFCRYLFDVYDIPNATQKIKKFKEDMPNTPFINQSQYEKILLSATQRESDIIKLLANLGLRASELCSLRPENISPNLSSIRIQGKGGKVRTIPCNQTVREILSRDIKFPKNRKSIYNICRKAGNRVGIHLAPHMLRRFFATSLVNKGVSLLIVSRLLGHTSLQTTEIYLKMDFSFLEGSTNVLDA